MANVLCETTVSELPDGRFSHVCLRCGATKITTTLRWFNPCGAATDPYDPWNLGDEASRLFAAVGVTKDRVQRWLGGPCGCTERQEKLNRLGQWLKRFTVGEDVAAEMTEAIPAEETAGCQAQ